MSTTSTVEKNGDGRLACIGIHSETDDLHQKLPAYSSLHGVNQPETNTNHTYENGYLSVRNGK
ncbi:hypothetical protein DPMN_114954 [Dreissena polymorpha]|uniref:Uncharacterized protein n=1 Tax=Dreissena polymorpha TaxID=45954 RepID=A0A9D4KL64_DREPO|nr:hypothetical protein DPMN_114954 [Dreissena polymorpha]